MRTLPKILLGAVGAVVVVFAAIAIAVAFVFEPNDYRPFLVDSVEKATGRDFALDGDLGLKLFPCCGVSIGSAKLGNPPGFPDEAFASIESASVSVKIWPLLTRREVMIGTVSLDGVDARLTELADGRTNWAFESDEAPAEPEVESESPIASLTIEGLEIRNGKVSYSAPGGRYSASDIRVDAGAIGGDSPVPVSASLTARDDGAGTSAEIELGGSLALDGDLVNLEEPRLSVRAKGSAIPTGEASAEVAGAALRYDTAAGTGSLQGLETTVSLPGTRIELTGNVELAGDAATGSGEFHIPEANLRQLLSAFPEAGYQPAGSAALERLTGGGRWTLTKSSAALGELNLKLDDSTITGSAGVTSFDTGAAKASISIDRIALDDYLPREEPPPAKEPAKAATAEPTEVPFESLADLLVDADLKIGDLVASGVTLQGLDAKVKSDGRAMSLAVESRLFGGSLKLNGNGTPGGASPSLAGQLEVSGISPRAALTALGETVDTANPEALTRLTGSTRWRLGRRSLALEQMSWQLDGTRMTGTLGVDDFESAATRFDIALDRINLDDYLAADTEETAADDGADVEVPAELIRGLDVKGHLAAAALTVMDLSLTNLDASVTAADGVLKLEPLKANLYGGTYQGTITIDATGAKSRLSLDQQISAVQIGQLLSALVGTDRMAGAVSFNLAGTGVGNTEKELLKALTGNVTFNLSDGVYRGMDIAYEIENAQSLLKRTAAPERPNRKETPIRALSFSGKMVDGVLGSDDLNAEIPFLKLGGKGGVNLLERTLDYQLNAQVLKSADNAPDSRLKSLAGSIIPLSIKGPMADPKVGVNLQGLVVETVKERARDEIFKRLGINEPSSGAGGTGSGTGGAGSGTPTETTQTVPAAQATPAEAPQTAASGGETSGGTGNATEAAPEPEAAQEAKPAEPPSTRDLIESGLRGLLKKSEKEKSSDN